MLDLVTDISPKKKRKTLQLKQAIVAEINTIYTHIIIVDSPNVPES